MVLFGDRDGDRHLNTETDVAAADDGNPNTPPTVQLEIVQRHFYYAYGMEMEGPWQLMPTMHDAYMYNDKELLLDLGMDLSDYGARYYDAVIGRWTGVDPLSEEYYGWSGYNYVLGNPIGLIDPTGMSAEGGPSNPSTGPLSDMLEWVRNFVSDITLPEVVVTADKPKPIPFRVKAAVVVDKAVRAITGVGEWGDVKHDTWQEGLTFAGGALYTAVDNVNTYNPYYQEGKVGVTLILGAAKKVGKGVLRGGTKKDRDRYLSQFPAEFKRWFHQWKQKKGDGNDSEDSFIDKMHEIWKEVGEPNKYHKSQLPDNE